MAIVDSFDNTTARFPRAGDDDYNATDRLARRHSACERRSAQRAGHSRVASAAGNERTRAVGSTHISIDNDRCRQRQSIDGCSSSDRYGANNIAIANASAGSGRKLYDTTASIFSTKLVAYDIASGNRL